VNVWYKVPIAFKLTHKVIPRPISHKSLYDTISRYIDLPFNYKFDPTDKSKHEIILHGDTTAPTFTMTRKSFFNSYFQRIKDIDVYEICTKNHIHGNVEIGFIVDEYGRISDFQIVKSVYKELDEQSLKMAKLLPKLEPATKLGKAIKVKVKCTFEYTIKAARYESANDEDTSKEDSNKSGDTTFAQFPGGEVALTNFLNHNIIYPPNAREFDIQGQVVVGFVVNEDGIISEIKIIKSVDKELDAEAVRVVKMLPKFKPASIHGKALKTNYMYPISFKLATENR
jgi:TonB family protein